MLIRGVMGPGEARGSAGPLTASRNQAGLFLRARVTPVNPKSPGQVAIRQAMASNSSRWSNILDNSQRSAWEAYAEETPLPNKLGDLVNTSGRQMYLRTNNARLQVGIGVIDTAPITQGVAEPPIGLVDSNTTDGVIVSLTTPTLAGNDVVIYTIGNPVSFAKNFYSSPYRTAAAAVAITGFPLELKPAAEVFVGQKYFIESRLFLDDGKVSMKIRQSAETIA